MTAALVAGYGVDFIDDHCVRGGQHRATGCGAEQHVQRFGRGDHDMRWTLAHRHALTLRRIAGAHGAANLDIGQTEFHEFGADTGQRAFEVDAHVVGQCLQRRDVDDRGFIRQRRFDTTAHQHIDRGEERGQRLARSGRRGDQRMPTGRDRWPCLLLRWRRRRECCAEPARDGGMQGGEWVGAGLHRIADLRITARQRWNMRSRRLKSSDATNGSANNE